MYGEMKYPPAVFLLAICQGLFFLIDNPSYLHPLSPFVKKGRGEGLS